MTGGVDSLALHPRQTSGLPSPFAFYSRPLRASLSWLSRCSRQLSVVRVSIQDSVQSFAHSDFNAAVCFWDPDHRGRAGLFPTRQG